MDTPQRISQAVSIVPIIVSLVILFVGGASSWFIVMEDIFPAVTSEETVILESHIDYNYHLNGVVLTWKDADGTVISDSKLDYSTATAQCDGPESTCMVYENRGAVFNNIGLVFYATLSLSIISSILIFLRDYEMIPVINKQFKMDLTKDDILSASFGAYISIILFALFLLLYATIAFPDAMHTDHAGGVKENLYTTEITVFGQNEGEYAIMEGEQVQLKSRWTIWTAFIIYLAGVLFSSIYLTSYTYGQLEDEPGVGVASEPELYFDPDAKLLFDVNTGEVIRSFGGDKRPLFFDTEANLLFDEETGDIVYSDYFDKLISEKIKLKEEDSKSTEEDSKSTEEDSKSTEEDTESEEEN